MDELFKQIFSEYGVIVAMMALAILALWRENVKIREKADERDTKAQEKIDSTNLKAVEAIITATNQQNNMLQTLVQLGNVITRQTDQFEGMKNEIYRMLREGRP